MKGERAIYPERAMNRERAMPYERTKQSERAMTTESASERAMAAIIPLTKQTDSPDKARERDGSLPEQVDVRKEKPEAIDLNSGFTDAPNLRVGDTVVFASKTGRKAKPKVMKIVGILR